MGVLFDRRGQEKKIGSCGLKYSITRVHNHTRAYQLSQYPVSADQCLSPTDPPLKYTTPTMTLFVSVLKCGGTALTKAYFSYIVSMSVNLKLPTLPFKY